ncbi:MAG: hypothetical protein TREMPRED_003658 [Tremellales sp. Tagirdzhanova-0007]|nr:MAG: hypothetical protein TREMPRED_003658 [Tremellales sp. Tagirdzhanova-0007]
MTTPPSIIVHATPSISPLPASEAESIYLASLLALACPGRWAITNVTWADNGGRLPYVTHLGNLIHPRHLVSLPEFEDPDERLSKGERAESMAWSAFVEQKVIDLVNHTLYSLPPNYAETTGKSHVENLKFPQNQYIPSRLRSLYQERLQHVGLWGMGGLSPGDEVENSRGVMDDAFVMGPAGTMAPKAWSGWRSGSEAAARRKKFGEEELIKIAKGVFEPLERRLGSTPYFFGDRPTALDLRLFAQLTLILSIQLVNPLLPNLLNSSFSTLVSHHDRVRSVLFPGESGSLPYVPQPERVATSWSEWFASAWSTEPKRDGRSASSKRAKDFRRARWMWFAGAGGAMMTYLLASGLVKLESGGNEELEDDEEEVEEDEEILVVEADFEEM